MYANVKINSYHKRLLMKYYRKNIRPHVTDQSTDLVFSDVFAPSLITTLFCVSFIGPLQNSHIHCT